jgi:anti-anti-sigma factor
MQPGQISIRTTKHTDVAVVAVSGDVDMLTAPALQDSINEILDDALTGLVIDLTDVQFLASVGLQVLAETHEKVRYSMRFAVVAANRATERPIQLTGLDEVLTVFPTLTDALDATRVDAVARN